MLRYQDVKPGVEKMSSFLGLIKESDSLDEVVAAANAWIDQQQVTVAVNGQKPGTQQQA